MSHNIPASWSDKSHYKQTPHVGRDIPAPTPATIYSLFPNIDRWALGFDPVFDTLKQLAEQKNSSYPPYNITKFGEGKFMVQVALAGFRKEDITIKVQDRVLTVSSEVEAPEEESLYGEVIHHGIAQRNFTQTFALAEYVEVDEAKMEDGILTINLVTNIPDEKKPKVIQIS